MTDLAGGATPLVLFAALPTLRLVAILCLGLAGAAPLGLIAYQSYVPRLKTVMDSRTGEVAASALQHARETPAEVSASGQALRETVNDYAGMAAWRSGVEAALRNARDPQPAGVLASTRAERPAESGNSDQAAASGPAEHPRNEQAEAAAKPQGEEAANPRAEKTVDPFARSPLIDRPGQSGDDRPIAGDGPIGVIPFVEPEEPLFRQMRARGFRRHSWTVRRFSFRWGAHRVTGIARSGW